MQNIEEKAKILGLEVDVLNLGGKEVMILCGKKSVPVDGVKSGRVYLSDNNRPISVICGDRVIKLEDVGSKIKYIDGKDKLIVGNSSNAEFWEVLKNEHGSSMDYVIDNKGNKIGAVELLRDRDISMLEDEIISGFKYIRDNNYKEVCEYDVFCAIKSLDFGSGRCIILNASDKDMPVVVKHSSKYELTKYGKVFNINKLIEKVWNKSVVKLDNFNAGVVLDLEFYDICRLFICKDSLIWVISRNNSNNIKKITKMVNGRIVDCVFSSEYDLKGGYGLNLFDIDVRVGILLDKDGVLCNCVSLEKDKYEVLARYDNGMEIKFDFIDFGVDKKKADMNIRMQSNDEAWYGEYKLW